MSALGWVSAWMFPSDPVASPPAPPIIISTVARDLITLVQKTAFYQKKGIQPERIHEKFSYSPCLGPPSAAVSAGGLTYSSVMSSCFMSPVELAFRGPDILKLNIRP